MLIKKTTVRHGNVIDVTVEQVKEVNLGSVRKPSNVVYFEYIPDGVLRYD